MGWNKKKDPIVLESSAPWDDGGRKYNVIYLIAGILGAILWMKGSLESKEGGSVIFIFCLIMGWLVKNCIVDWIWRDLRKLRFRLETPVPYDELIEKLIPRLLPLGMSIEKDTKGRPVIKYKRIIFDIFYTDNNTAFCIWWSLSFARKLFNPRGAISYYGETVSGMAIIGYAIQQVCKQEDSTETDIQNEEE